MIIQNIQSFSRLIAPVVDYFFPRYCLLCQEQSFSREVCDPCYQKTLNLKLTAIDPPETDFRTFHLSSAQYSGAFADLVAATKFNHDPYPMPLFERLMHQSCQELKHFECDLITAVPGVLQRILKRKMDFPNLLARFISKQLQTPFEEKLIERLKNTPSQTTLSFEQRVLNPQKAFAVSRSLNQTRVLLVDDVWTTGSTALSISSALYNSGASKVFVFTLCRTPIK